MPLGTILKPCYPFSNVHLAQRSRLAEEWNELITFVSERWDLDTEDGDDDLSQKIEDGLNAGIELIRMTQLFKV